MKKRMNDALLALTGSGDWTLVREVPPDLLVIVTADGRHWAVQAEPVPAGGGRP